MSEPIIVINGEVVKPAKKVKAREVGIDFEKLVKEAEEKKNEQR